MIAAVNKQKILALAAILVITFFVFLPSLGNHFTNWDDGALLADNQDIQRHDMSNFKNIFTKTYVGTYIPLTLLTFNLEHYFFKSAPVFYYFDNLLLHLGVVALIFFFGQRLGLSVMASGFAALVFGVHPMHVESVAWISQRKDVLYSLFYMAALLQYLNFCDQKKKRFYGWALFFALCSILAKPMAYSLPLVMLLCDWFRGRKIDVKAIIEKLPFFLIIGAVSLVTYTANSHAIELNIFQILLFWAWVFVFHLQKFFFPYPLLPAYELPQLITLNYFECVMAVIIVLLAVVLGVLKFRRWFLFAILFYFLSNAMIIFRVIWEFGNNTTVADRFMYLPSLGICLALGAGYQYLRTHVRYQPLVSIFFGAICLGLIVLSINQVQVWKDNISLWSHVLKYNSHSTIAYQNRAAGYGEIKKYDLAKMDLDTALKLNPHSPELYLARADIFEKQQSLEKALVDLNRALALNPSYANAYYARAGIFYNLRQSEKALADYTAAIELKTDFDRAYYNRAMIYDDDGKSALALADYAQVIRINPQHPKVYNNRAVVYINSGDYEKAQKDLLIAIKIDSRNSQAYGNLGIVAFVDQKFAVAIKYLEQALVLDPENIEAKKLLTHIKGE